MSSYNVNINESPNHFMILDAIARGMTNSLYQKNLSIKLVSLKHTVDDVVTIGKKRNYDFQRYIERNK
jgi:sulfur transfer complex TusBCD TusB component (DsrH family)